MRDITRPFPLHRFYLFLSLLFAPSSTFSAPWPFLPSLFSSILIRRRTHRSVPKRGDRFHRARRESGELARTGRGLQGQTPSRVSAFSFVTARRYFIAYFHVATVVHDGDVHNNDLSELLITSRALTSCFPLRRVVVAGCFMFHVYIHARLILLVYRIIGAFACKCIIYVCFLNVY